MRWDEKWERNVHVSDKETLKTSRWYGTGFVQACFILSKIVSWNSFLNMEYRKTVISNDGILDVQWETAA